MLFAKAAHAVVEEDLLVYLKGLVIFGQDYQPSLSKNHDETDGVAGGMWRTQLETQEAQILPG